jgi:hypothetical protein
LFAPLNVNVDVPAFVNEKAPPLTAPLKTTALAVVSVVLAFNVPTPVNVSCPVFAAFPSVKIPPNE